MLGTRMDVLIVTALKDELDAVLALEEKGGEPIWELKRDQDGMTYHVREIPNEKGETLRVAVAWSGAMGESEAAFRAAQLIDELDPECLAMCGICAGRRGEVFLGDVIVADRVFSYDHGKFVAGRRGKGNDFLRDIKTYNLPDAWKMDAEYFARDFQKSWNGVLKRPLSKDAQVRWLLLTLDAHERNGGPPPISHPERKERCPGWAAHLRDLEKKRLVTLDEVSGALKLTEKGRGWVSRERLRDPDGEWREPDFRVHVAPLATGKAVREDPVLFRELAQGVRKVLDGTARA